MFDSQLFRTVRDIRKKNISYKYLHRLQNEKEDLKKLPSSRETAKKIANTQDKIDKILFVPEIISIVMESLSDYRYLYKSKLKLNNKEYRRISCSAGQARVSTVIFCDTEIADELDEILDNRRDKKKKLVPSKFNAYKGLITSSTSVVSTPRFCLAPDYKSDTTFDVNFVTETELHKDDIIDVRSTTETFNRFDGQGLVSVKMANKWAEELGLDYTPSQWCIRAPYCKGMLTVMDMKSFCDTELKEYKIGEDRYMIKTSYKDENGEYKMVDIRNIDVVISESQLKLWDSYSSIEDYQDNCKKNNLKWGVALASPKKDKDILKMNYQFLQTIRIESNRDIEKICGEFVDWISGVTSKDIYYTLLFLLGTDVDEYGIVKYLDSSDNYWIKALMLNHELIKDIWFKKKIYDLIKKKIKKGCLGEILLDGNFSVLVSDPYAQMQHVCGIPVTGLLDKREYYSHYWNEKGVKFVDSMRAPLTYRSEHLLLNLKNDERARHWYQYNTTGIIVNVHGSETVNWAGSDFDMDIIATTSDETVIKGVYQNELPIMYEPPKSEPKILKDRDLFDADKHSFGSEIGQITNKSTSGYALLADLEEGSREYEVTMTRIKMCTKLQSAQIDKAKIGRKVKSIPKTWTNYIEYEDGDTEEIKKEKDFLNRISLRKHPYFFIYLYKGTRRSYKKYYSNQDITCRQRFGKSIDELISAKRKTKEELDFLNEFKKKSPVIDSDCTMNKICKYIESIDFGIRRIAQDESDEELHTLLMSGNVSEFDNSICKKIVKAIQDFKDLSHGLASTSDTSVRDDLDEEVEANIDITYTELEAKLIEICSNVNILVDYLIYIFYVRNKGFNKEVLWKIFGSYIIENLRLKTNKIVVPVPDENGEIEYLNKKYTLKEVLV